MTALQAVCPDYCPADVDEFLIWREANTVFMGDGHPGCSPYGLGLAAVRRGARITIWISQREHLFAETVQDPYQRHAMALVERHDFTAAGNASVPIIEKNFLVPEVLGRPENAVLLLVRDAEGADYHWITLVRREAGTWVSFDPDPQSAGFTAVTADILTQRCSGHQAALFLRGA